MYYKIQDKNEAIKVLQKYLSDIAKRNDIFLNGIYDKRTKDALKAYQLSRGLVSSGIVDHKTWELLRADYKRKSFTQDTSLRFPYKVGDYGKEIALLKNMVNRIIIHYPNFVKVDNGLLYSNEFGETVRILRKIMLLDYSTEFDETLYQRLGEEIQIYKKLQKIKVDS